MGRLWIYNPTASANTWPLEADTSWCESNEVHWGEAQTQTPIYKEPVLLVMPAPKKGDKWLAKTLRKMGR